ncbi:PadR family transcriptional regulator [Amycolatopsis jiangsuensis]|uniref:DNA-binding PadR family transcriptional regulator n=1 Tax=Amycolatopsis jiangsuensis TaxID=1181879 RepID=A0A840IRA6_9PSEU|nr:PadR family transcriptional regulator [Amycolatopsis jiangsuensis]MBB4683907.1 DNA-binding PadR family transcriptional regulator [Amycolatopsis jiangsuensis]
MRTLTALGLTVLRLLADAPSHPYELRQQMREQGLDQFVKVTHGALYHTVETLAKEALIEPVATLREGKRPERTVYSITAAGRELARDRLRALLVSPAAEYSTYGTALACLSLLSTETAAERLERRCVLLEGQLAASQTEYDALRKHGMPAVALVEIRHLQAHQRADLDLTRALVDEIRGGRLDWQPLGADPAPED